MPSGAQSEQDAEAEPRLLRAPAPEGPEPAGLLGSEPWGGGSAGGRGAARQLEAQTTG